ncbi:MAG: zinc ribbon domain-containing protein [Methanospirillum sp.]|nr:zinc ribbon domain-containing protein [Methanospirillum sp.]
MDNIRGGRTDTDEPGGGKFNPFRILEIGESMIRYCDGIRIKDYNFLAIYTSDRLVLIDSAQQSSGLIAKEIPALMVKGAVMERDERNRPTLAVSMEVGGQSRLMRLIFTGLIAEPETECREWFTIINGYPPEPEVKQPETKKEEPAISQPVIEPETVPPPTPEPSVQEQVTEAVPEAVPQVNESPAQEIESEPVQVPDKPVPVPEVPVSTPKSPPRIMIQETKPAEKQRLVLPTQPEGSVHIFIEKPDISPVRIQRKILLPSGSGKGKTRFCIHCGSRITVSARFCPVCGKSQV